MKKSITIRLDEDLLHKIDQFSESRNINRTQAITAMLESTRIVIIKEGAEIINLLYMLDNYLIHNNDREIRRVCNSLWQLFDSITEKTPPQISPEANSNES